MSVQNACDIAYCTGRFIEILVYWPIKKKRQ